MTAPLRHLSVCSGIGAPDLAWQGWFSEPLAFCEIEPFPSLVLAHHFPGVPNLGDMTKWREWPEDILAAADILVGGTPCQSFSISGSRGGLSDQRGNLALEFIQLANAIDNLRRTHGRPPCWIVWENVPGIFADEDNAFGHFLAGLCGGESPVEQAQSRRSAGVVMGANRCAGWRVLDAVFFGVAQRRRRLFVVARGHSGSAGYDAADALLPIRESRQWHLAPIRETRGEVAADSAGGAGASRQFLTSSSGDVSRALKARDGTGVSSDITGDGAPLIVEGMLGDVSPSLSASTGGVWEDGSGRGNPIIALNARQDPITSEDHTGPLDTFQNTHAIAFNLRGREEGNVPELAPEDTAPTLRASGGGSSNPFLAIAQNTRNEVRILSGHGQTTEALAANAGIKQQSYIVHTETLVVRRITPTEAERLQGFPDGYTAILNGKGRPAGDTPRMAALGNSWAVPCGRFLAQGIAAVDPRCAKDGT